jgi:predicted pyridoxine 5'-phosphate oxidase superfamily flavin-nucleotide-binding protein
MEFTDHLTDAHAEMIGKQAIFFTATAARDGRINLSPKGLADTFKVLGPKRWPILIWADRGMKPTRIWRRTAGSRS